MMSDLQRPEIGLPRRSMRARSIPGDKIVVAGTSRDGAAILVQILTQLGMYTGMPSERLCSIDEPTGDGVTSAHVDELESLQVVNDPTLSIRFGELFDEGSVPIDHVIIPIRRLDRAAVRLSTSESRRNIFIRGGPSSTWRQAKQRDAQAIMLYDLIYALAEHEIPHTLLEFPRFVTDYNYTFRALWFLAPTMTLNDFRYALQSVTDTEQAPT